MTSVASPLSIQEYDARKARAYGTAPPLQELLSVHSTPPTTLPLQAEKVERIAAPLFPMKTSTQEAESLVKRKWSSQGVEEKALAASLLALDKMEIAFIHEGLTLHLEFQEKDLTKLHRLREEARQQAQKLSRQLQVAARLDKLHMGAAWVSGLVSFVAGIVACATGIGALPGGAMILSGAVSMGHLAMSQFGGWRLLVESTASGSKERKANIVRKVESAVGWTVAGLSIGTTVIGGGLANTGSAVVKVLGTGDMLGITVGSLADGLKAWGDSRAKYTQQKHTLARAQAEAHDNRHDSQDELQHLIQAWQRFLARTEKGRHQQGSLLLQMAQRTGF